ncbi:O-methyltransferase [Oligoflexus tunisiensis]|uniref:O-methyltransferase n=1 Tax=Oligoflexus tunisiensis TaxID=708132 RepID=UPI00114CE18C|nr:class I SAM-dependent methyltransferase [Oligoflexus tunisiensis]
MKTVPMTETVYEYLVQHQTPLHPVLPELIAITRQRPDAGMQIAEDQGVFMNQLVRLIGARRILEIGCFTGYSTICMGLGLPEGGEIISCDIDPETTGIARQYLKAAGLEKKSQILLGPAVDTMQKLLTNRGKNSFDLIFIDADKENYGSYYEIGLELLRPNGVILADNVLWSGRIIDPADNTPSTEALRRFNAVVRKDSRVEASMLSLADGLYMIRKKG